MIIGRCAFCDGLLSENPLSLGSSLNNPDAWITRSGHPGDTVPVPSLRLVHGSRYR